MLFWDKKTTTPPKKNIQAVAGDSETIKIVIFRHETKSLHSQTLVITFADSNIPVGTLNEDKDFRLRLPPHQNSSVLFSHLLQTRTGLSHPRSGTGLLPGEQSSQTPWPQARQWWMGLLAPNSSWHTMQALI